MATFAGVFMLTWSSTKKQEQDDEERGAAEQEPEERQASVILRRSVRVNPALVTAVAGSIERPAPVLRAKSSSLTQASVVLIGLSPAQRLLAWTPSEERDSPL